MMITRKIATALAAGCTMIIKPAEETPLTAYKLLEYARQAGIPAGVFEMVTGDPQAIGEAFTSDTRIHKNLPSPDLPASANCWRSSAGPR